MRAFIGPKQIPARGGPLAPTRLPPASEPARPPGHPAPGPTGRPSAADPRLRPSLIGLSPARCSPATRPHRQISVCYEADGQGAGSAEARREEGAEGAAPGGRGGRGGLGGLRGTRRATTGRRRRRPRAAARRPPRTTLLVTLDNLVQIDRLSPPPYLPATSLSNVCPINFLFANDPLSHT